MRRRGEDGGGAGAVPDRPDQEGPRGAGVGRERAAGQALPSSTVDALTSGAAPGSSAALIATWRAILAGDRDHGLMDLDGLDDGARLAVLRELELLARTSAAVAARVQVVFQVSQVEHQIASGIPRYRAGRAVADDLAQARMTSPYWGSRDLTCARALVAELPHTLQALETGVISAHQARVVSEATTVLDPEDRAEVDQRLASRLPGASTKEIGAAARALVYEVDPAGFVERARRAAKDRGVSMRPTSDVMGTLSARLPAPMAIAVYQALRSAAIAKQASGDPRSLNGLMADELYERLTGRSVVDAIDVEVGLVITDAALFAGTSDSAELLGYGPIPAELARELLRPHDGGAGAESGFEPAPTEESAQEAMESEPKAAESQPATEPELHPGPPLSGRAGDPTRDEESPRADELTQDQVIARARADAAANANGFPGGRAPEGHCPVGGRCVDFSCTLIHGVPSTSGEQPLHLPRPEAIPRSAPSPPSEPATSGPPSSPPVPSVPGSPSLRRSPGAGECPSSPPSGVARAARAWIRRLFTDPQTGVLTARDPRKRLFSGELRAFLVARDRTCRNTWCGAPIRTVDHIERHADGGLTTKDNGQGLCQRCNLARERARHRAPAARDYRPPPPKLDTIPRRPAAGSETTSRPRSPGITRSGSSGSNAQPARGGSDPAGP